jgi:hypothetical protein
MTDDNGPFPQSALDANQAGQLTDAQRQLLRAGSRSVRKGELSAALFAATFGIFLFIAARPSSPALVRVVIPIGLLAVAAFLLLRALTGEDRLTRDLRSPRVESLEGPISRHIDTTHSRSASLNDYYLDVAGQRFKVGPHAYDAAPDAGYVRIYFLPISRHVVNLEHLPDRSLPEGTTVKTLAQELKQAVHSHDRAQIDELRAEMAGTGHAVNATISHDAVPPPEANQDQRPLADAIQGTWSNGPVTAVFSEDGSFSVTILGANEQDGHWSVDGNGKLVADFRGREQATDAWIAGGQLTVSLGGDAITLKRQST